MIAGGGVTGGAEAAIAQAPVAATTTSPPASALTSVGSKLPEQQLAGHIGLEASQLTCDPRYALAPCHLVARVGAIAGISGEPPCPWG